MKTRQFAALLILLCLCALTFSFAAVSSTTRTWTPVYNLKTPAGINIFFDQKSIVKRRIKDSDMASGEFLIIYNDNQTVMVDGKPKTVRSLVKNYIIDCKQMTVSPLYDMWFAEGIKLTGNEVPVAIKEYNVKTSNMPIQKSNFIFQILCPNPV